MEDLTPEKIMDHLAEHLTGVDAMVACDSHVSGDGIIETMLATGHWKLSDEVTYCAGKPIRTLVPVKS